MNPPLRRIALTAIVAAALAASGVASGAGVSDTEILIGTHMDLSGPTAAGMPQIRNGVQMRIDEANEAGGVNGRKLRLIVEDNALQPAQAVRAVQKLTRKDEVFAIISSFGSGPNAAAVKTSVDAGTIYFAPWGASAIIQAQGGKSPLVFTTQPNYDGTMAAGLSWAIKAWGAKKVGVIYQGDAYGELVRRGIKTAMDAAGMQPVAEAAYKPGDVDFSSQVARVRQAGADLVVIATVLRETIGVMAEIKKIGWTDVKVLASNAARTSVVILLGKEAVEGLYGLGGWRMVYVDSGSAAVKAWADSYRKRFNLTPDENAMVSYSYTEWFLKGVQAAGRNLTTDSFVKAMGSVTHEDFTTYSRVSFKNNHLDPEVIHLEQIKGGRWIPVSPEIVIGK
jgi:ABC-type branched-subunit amino acid transport system substrate-binding protein